MTIKMRIVRWRMKFVDWALQRRRRFYPGDFIKIHNQDDPVMVTSNKSTKIKVKPND